MNVDAIIRVDGLKKRFGETSAVAGLSFEMRRGEVFGLIGPDGAGKSTTLRVLAGLLGADEGTAHVAGVNVLTDPEAVKPRIGYMPQQFSLYGDLSVEENLRFFAAMFFVPRAERAARFARLYEFSRLAPFTKRRAEALSGGMQKKLALSCVLIHSPELLLLDEPTTGVDPVSRRELWDMLYRLVSDGLSILVSTPYMDEAERCHRVGLMHEGRMMRLGPPREVREGMDAPLLALHGADVHRIVRGLRDDARIASAYPAGSVVHAVLAADAGDPVAVCAALAASFPEIERAEPVRPTFEDAFIRLVERER
jgi:ABC-2 type transport system ATP-binding protein